MLHDKLIFRPNRCDYDLPTSPASFEPRESKQPPPPRITEILKRPCPTPEVPKRSAPLVSTSEEPTNDGNESPITSALTKRTRKSRKKSKKGKKPGTKEPLNKSKPVSIAMIGAAAFRSLIRKKDVQIFSITPN
jgi:hypothetical protein